MAAAAGRRADTCPDVPARAWRPSGWLIASAGAHLAAGGLLLAAPRRWPVAAAALAGNHLALAAAGLWPRSQVLGPAVVRLPAAAAARGEVGLTFDDGPDPRVTPRVAEWLARRGARASFFCVGRRAERHPELIAELVRLGHRVENHSHSHPNAFAFYGAAAQRREIRRAQAVLAATAGAPPAYFRAPAGFRNLLLERELAAAGLWLAAWTRRGFDTVSRDPRRIAGRLLRGLAAGDVLLLHDGSPAADRRGQPVVLAALDRLLDGLEAHGLRAVPLPPPLPALPELPPLIGAGEEAS
jgi:peptidoglycan/xylan/chitin deacetylase (PgdA/CDA1 family)